MKTRRSFSLSEIPKNKKIKLNPSFFQDTLPAEMWLEVIKNLDKKSFRELLATCRGLYEFANDFVLFLNAPWPEIDFQQHRQAIHIVIKYLNFNKPRIIPLQNGDIVVGMKEGFFFLLKFGEKKWQTFRSESEFLFNQIHDVILLSNGDLASGAKDGIRVWDRTLNKQKYWVKIPAFSVNDWRLANLTDDIRAQYLFEMPDKSLICVCWDGNIHFLVLQETIFGPQYRLNEWMQIKGEDANFHVCHAYIVENEIIAECEKFIARIDWKNRKLIEKITYADNKETLANAICTHVSKELNEEAVNNLRQYLLTNDDITLEFDWSYPHGYVGLKVDSEFDLLVNLADKTKKELVLGRSGECVTCVTNDDDIICFDSSKGFLYSRWDHQRNEFRLQCDVLLFNEKEEDVFLTTDGRLLRYIPGKGEMLIQDAYTSEVGFVLLKERTDLEKIIAVIQHDYLLGTVKKHASCVWDLRNGNLLFTFPKRKCELTPLPNGDIMKEIEKHRFVDQSNGAGIGVHEHEDHIEVHRFGLRK